MGWAAEAPLILLCSLLRSWEDRFGARVIAFQGPRIYISVARPPRTTEHAAHVALEHALTTADNINDGTTPFPGYAPSLVDAQLWEFWWDQPSSLGTAAAVLRGPGPFARLQGSPPTMSRLRYPRRRRWH